MLEARTKIAKAREERQKDGEGTTDGEVNDSKDF